VSHPAGRALPAEEHIGREDQAHPAFCFAWAAKGRRHRRPHRHRHRL